MKKEKASFFMLLIPSLLLLLDVNAAQPDFFADVLTGDGIGGIDSGYKNKRDDYPKTSRILFSYYTSNGGKGSSPGPVATGNHRSVFGYVVDNDNKFLFRYDSSSTGQIWFSPNKYKTVGSNANGDVLIELDQENDTARWGENFYEGVTGADEISKKPFYLFSHNYGEVFNPSVIDFKYMKIYEANSNGGEEKLVRCYKPCYFKGRVGVYESVTDTIIYPTSEGFTISGYDISLSSDDTLLVTDKCSSPRNLLLSDGASLLFDGNVPIVSQNQIVLPDQGKVRVSLLKGSGKKRYALLDNLPDDFSLTSFEIASVPYGSAGELSKDGKKLILTLRAEHTDLPEAIADSVKSDGHGYFDIGYAYLCTDELKTSRIEFDYSSTDNGKGSYPGPVVSGATHVLFGYQSDSLKTIFRYSGDNGQIWHEGGSIAVNSGLSGDISLGVDYISKKASWGEVSGEINECNKSVPYNFYVYAVNLNGAPSYLSVFDFKSMRVYERDSAHEVLVRDFVPCINDGKIGIFDKVNSGCIYPNGSTNGFTVSNPQWRLNVNGEVLFGKGVQQFSYLGSKAVSGWMLIRDFDGSIITKGDGATAEFLMPECAASLIWAEENLLIESGVKHTVDNRIIVDSLSFESNAGLSFNEGACIYIRGDIVLPAVGKIEISYPNGTVCGTYALLQGIPESIPMSQFVLAELPKGFNGVLERNDDRLMLRLEGAPEFLVGLPDAFAESVKSDGHGCFDTGYKYKAGKTSRILFDFNTYDYAKGTSPGPTAPEDIRSIMGFQKDSNKTIVRYSNKTLQVFDQEKGVSYNNENNDINKGDMTFAIDYRNGCFIWGVASNDGYSWSNSDSVFSYYIFAVNLKGDISRPSVYDFKGMKVFETENSDEQMVCDFVPCFNNGKAAIYDKVAKKVIYPQGDTNGFAVSKLIYPPCVYGSVATQRFAHISTISHRQVKQRRFSAMETYEFIADGEIRAIEDLGDVSVNRYDGEGSVLSVDALGSIKAGNCFAVEMNRAAKAVVRFAHSGENTVVSCFDVAEVQTKVRPAEMNVEDKRTRNIFLSGDATFVFKMNLSEAVAKIYDLNDNVIEEKSLSPLSAGGAVSLQLGEGAYCIVKMTLAPPGLFISVR